MNKKGVIIQGSARGDGNTNKITLFIKEHTGYDIIDLKTKNIGEFDYNFENSNDDYLPLMKEIVEKYDTIVFISPVYWYSMSGIMKTFFDRISDCLYVEKELGRKLRGKNMAVISCGSDSKEVEGFSLPFEKSADYLGMKYLGYAHSWLEDSTISESLKIKLIDFVKSFENI